jgi:hypothetical protein
MKKVIILFSFILIGISAHCQEQNKQFTDPLYDLSSSNDTTILSSNIIRYSNARRLGYAFNVVGVCGIVASGFTEDEDMQRNLLLIGSGLNVAGYVVQMCGEKWLKRHAIEITNTGIVKRF